VWPTHVSALTPGTLVYRTSNDGRMVGYSGDNLVSVDENQVLKQIYPGHAGIYIGKENGEDYIVEALVGGIVKMPAKYFVNEALGEKLLGAKIPKAASTLEIVKAVEIAKSLVGEKIGYDFDFKTQKGPGDGEWTCVGLTEKVYESAGISNPSNLGALEYNPDYYAVDITPDGFDNKSLANRYGDCFSKTLEFSKIGRRTDIRLPLPEIVGFNLGLEYQGDRYFFLPYTQFIQPSLRDEKVDINLQTFFDDDSIRGKTPVARLLLRWSLINNPISSLKIIAQATSQTISNWKNKIFGTKNETQIVLENENKAENNSNNIIADNQLSPPQIKINQATKDEQPVIVKDSSEDNELNDTREVVKIALAPTIKLASTTSISATANPVAISNLKAVVSSSTSSSLKTAIPKLVSSVNITAVPSAADSIKVAPASSKIVAGIKPNTNQSSSNTQTTNSSSFNSPNALINKIYSTENNDFIELYNPTNYDFDLAEAGFRLEKAKTAVDPGLMMRIGNTSDGSYPGGTVIKAKGYYLIVRDDANSYYKNKADAIAIRNEFSWTSSGYIIYLGKGAISSTTDEDIIDAVGFGEATYFQGSGPAPVINDNYILNRLKSSGNNVSDFNLIVSDDPSIVWNEDESENTNNTNDNSNNNQNDNQENNQSSNNPDLFVAKEPIVSEGISDLWHFSECYGDQNYSIGRFDCAIDIGFVNPKFSRQLSSKIDLNKFSISFYYRSPKMARNYSRLTFKLRNESGQELKVMLDEAFLQIEGLPNSAWQYYAVPVFPDDAWHQFSLVVDKETGYWSVYFDAQEKYRHTFVQTLADNFSSLEFDGDCGPASMDELALWTRPLSSTEILADFVAAVPFSPISSRVAQKEAELKYFWNFNEGNELVNEGGGLQAIDEINNIKLILPENSWVWRGSENTGIINRWDKNLNVDFPTFLKTKDLSLTFWWRSEISSLGGRSLISLNYNDRIKMGLSPDFYRRSFYFNNNDGAFSEGSDIDIPYDDKWHHIALTYDSYRYLLKFYVDGQEKRSLPFFWIKDGEEPNHLEIRSELNSVELDDLGVWEGAVTASSVQKIYQDSKVN